MVGIGSGRPDGNVVLVSPAGDFSSGRASLRGLTGFVTESPGGAVSEVGASSGVLGVPLATLLSEEFSMM